MQAKCFRTTEIEAGKSHVDCSPDQPLLIAATSGPHDGYGVLNWTALNTWALGNDSTWADAAIDATLLGFNDVDTLRLICAELLHEKRKAEKAAQVAKVPPAPPVPVETNFGWALAAMKKGKRVARNLWSVGNWIVIVKKDNYAVNSLQDTTRKPETLSTVSGLRPWIGFRAPNGEFGPWTATEIDLLATDWFIVEPKS